MAAARAWTGWALVAAATFAPGCASARGGGVESWAGDRPAAAETCWDASVTTSPRPRGFWRKLWYPFTKEAREEAKLQAAMHPKRQESDGEVIFEILIRMMFLGMG